MKILLIQFQIGDNQTNNWKSKIVKIDNQTKNWI